MQHFFVWFQIELCVRCVSIWEKPISTLSKIILTSNQTSRTNTHRLMGTLTSYIFPRLSILHTLHRRPYMFHMDIPTKTKIWCFPCLQKLQAFRRKSFSFKDHLCPEWLGWRVSQFQIFSHLTRHSNEASLSSRPWSKWSGRAETPSHCRARINTLGSGKSSSNLLVGFVSNSLLHNKHTANPCPRKSKSIPSFIQKIHRL